jgi:hypothetical protein
MLLGGVGVDTDHDFESLRRCWERAEGLDERERGDQGRTNELQAAGV